MAAEESDDERDEKPEGKPGENPAKGTPEAKKKDQKKQTIIAAAAILGVIIAWLTFRKSSGGGGATSTAPAGGSIGAYTPAGNVAGSGDSSAAFAGLQSLLSNQSQQLQSLESAIVGLTPAPSTADTPTVTPPAFQLGSSAANDQYLVDYTDSLPGGALTGSIYQVQPNGSGGVQYYHLNPEEWSLVNAQPGYDPTKVAIAGAPPKTS